jgi:hypothetical protein
MLYERDKILQELRDHVIELTFNDNGKHPMGRFSLRPDMLPKSYTLEEEAIEREFHKTNPTVISAWNVTSHRWVSFNAADIIFAQDMNEKY